MRLMVANLDTVDVDMILLWWFCFTLEILSEWTKCVYNQTEAYLYMHNES
jgi:hypothetical protein